MDVDLEKLNSIIGDLPKTAMGLMPDDATLQFLVARVPSPVTKDNAKTMLIVVSLICRLMALRFNDLAAEQENIIRAWQN